MQNKKEKKEKLIKTSIQVSQAHIDALTEIANEQSTSYACIIRQIIKKHLENLNKK